MLPEMLPPDARRVAVVSQKEIGFDVDAGRSTERFYVVQGEVAKSLACVEELCRGFSRAGLSRSDAVVAVGGGVVTDVAGLAAAVYLRGVALVNVATTLLAQVDAAIGGKTGVNIAEGKNLIGAFWQPEAVLCDTDALATLPPREWTSGRGEIAKCAFLGQLIGESPSDAGREVSWAWTLPLEDQIARCVRIKAAVVGADERERDARALLNYGHTLAHALEAQALSGTEPVDLRHGEAVGIGLVFAALLAQRLGRIDDEVVQLHRKVLDSLGLPGELPGWADARALLDFMSRDKKSRHDLTFVLDGRKGVELVHGVDETEVMGTLSDMERAR